MRTATLLMLLAVIPVAAQVRSDYQTVKEFEGRTKQLSVLIDSAKTVQECADIRVSIEQLRAEFEGDKELLDRSLYGENFDQRLQRVTGQLVLAERKIGVIESQISRIVDLETQVRELSAKVDELSSENARLLSDVGRLSENVRGLSAAGMETSNMVDSLKKVIGRLQRGLRERDEMIFALVDSLFLQYDKDLTQASDKQLQGMAIKLDRNNVISGVVTSIENNISFLDRAELTGADLASILNDQERFSSQWKGIGPKLASIYVSRKNRATELAGIDTLLSRWSQKADEAMWRELNRGFRSRGLAVDTFANGREFAAALLRYVDNVMTRGADGMGMDTTWAAFNAFWSDDLEPSWIPLMVKRENISEADSAMLADKVGAWRSEMEPTSPFVYALIFIVIVSLLAVGYARFIRNKPPASA